MAGPWSSQGFRAYSALNAGQLGPNRSKGGCASRIGGDTDLATHADTSAPTMEANSELEVWNRMLITSFQLIL